VKRFGIVAAGLSMAFGLMVSTPALAGERDAVVRTAPCASAPQPTGFEVIEDGEQSLKIIGTPAATGTGIELTLVYDGPEGVKVAAFDPALVATAQSAAYAAFLDQVDPGFLSFVRASLADRLLHMQTLPCAFDRATTALFFPARTEPTEYIGVQSGAE
jgi:hypothetical protein